MVLLTSAELYEAIKALFFFNLAIWNAVWSSVVFVWCSRWTVWWENNKCTAVMAGVLFHEWLSPGVFHSNGRILSLLPFSALWRDLLPKRDFPAFLSFDEDSHWFLPPHFEAAIHWISAGSRNPVHRVQLIFHEQQLCCGGLLFLLFPLDDAVIEPSSSHLYGLAANMCNNGFIVRSCKIKRWLGFEVER